MKDSDDDRPLCKLRKLIPSARIKSVKKAKENLICKFCDTALYSKFKEGGVCAKCRKAHLLPSAVYKHQKEKDEADVESMRAGAAMVGAKSGQ